MLKLARRERLASCRHRGGARVLRAKMFQNAGAIKKYKK
jgi:hypothetical protein